MALVDYSSEEEAQPVLSSDEEEESASGGGDDAIRQQNGGSNQDQGQQPLEYEDEAVEPIPTSSLLSPDEAFAEITGPPEFLKHAISSEKLEQQRQLQQEQQQKKSVDAVVEAKPQLLPRSNTEAVKDPAAVAENEETTQRLIQPQNPPAKDAAELLRMCLQCGVPKTSSEGRMVCPVCRDNPRNEPEPLEKKRPPKVKDKEKSKRMKGQSSHATWKSETEMQLRQQFD